MVLDDLEMRCKYSRIGTFSSMSVETPRLAPANQLSRTTLCLRHYARNWVGDKASEFGFRIVVLRWITEWKQSYSKSEPRVRGDMWAVLKTVGRKQPFPSITGWVSRSMESVRHTGAKTSHFSEPESHDFVWRVVPEFQKQVISANPNHTTLCGESCRSFKNKSFQRTRITRLCVASRAGVSKTSHFSEPESHDFVWRVVPEFQKQVISANPNHTTLCGESCRSFKNKSFQRTRITRLCVASRAGVCRTKEVDFTYLVLSVCSAPNHQTAA